MGSPHPPPGEPNERPDPNQGPLLGPDPKPIPGPDPGPIPGPLPGPDPGPPPGPGPRQEPLWTPPAHGHPYGEPLPPLAGRGRRLAAGVLDLIILGIITSPLTYDSWTAASQLTKYSQFTTSDYFWTLVVTFLYFWLLHGYWHGQTLGKRLLGIRVVPETGGRIVPGQAAIRSAVLSIVYLTCCLSFVDLVWILFDPRKQALHDKAARTLVVDARS
ncbi:RDD family protein [Acrocarpospora catenulata]|uniref:RDD family protein n=1 Tax=Acrocarpospora catenulata TaxID=2836182 RepID=UPI001BD97D65|nr:RDD family protein [Acrocarpospora catenulata]